MKGLGVLDGQIVQPEKALDLDQLGGVRIQQGDPDKARLVLPEYLGGRIELQLFLSLANSVSVMGTVDNHLGPPPGVAAGW